MSLILDDHDGGGGHDEGESIWLLSYSDLMTLLMGFFALMMSMASFDTENFAHVGQGAAEYFGGETDQSFKELSKSLEGMINKKGLGDQVKLTSGLTEVVITFEGTLFFASGSIRMKKRARTLMREVIKIVGDKAPKKRVLIEGHTDDTPIHSGVITSNWELSALRASRVARLFEEFGFKKQQIMIIGWGEVRPLEPNRDESGRANAINQSKNRRVVLKILDNHPL